MNKIKPIIQDAADKINDPIVNDNISAIRAAVILDKKGTEAIHEYRQEKENAKLAKEKEDVIITGEQAREEMNR